MPRRTTLTQEQRRARQRLYTRQSYNQKHGELKWQEAPIFNRTHHHQVNVLPALQATPRHVALRNIGPLYQAFFRRLFHLPVSHAPQKDTAARIMVEFLLGNRVSSWQSTAPRKVTAARSWLSRSAARQARLRRDLRNPGHSLRQCCRQPWSKRRRVGRTESSASGQGTEPWANV